MLGLPTHLTQPSDRQNTSQDRPHPTQPQPDRIPAIWNNPNLSAGFSMLEGEHFSSGRPRAPYPSYAANRMPPPALPRRPLTQQDIEQRLETTFIVITSCAVFLLATLSPLLSFMLLGASTVGLGLSLPYWSNQGNLRQEPQLRQLETWEKALYAAAIPFAALLLGQFYPLFQLLLCTAIGGFLSYFFIDECILKSRNDLNKALREAVIVGDLELIKKALALGADPLAPDLEIPTSAADVSEPMPNAQAAGASTDLSGATPSASTEPNQETPRPVRIASLNTAIHLAIQNPAHAQAILQLFNNQLKKPAMPLKEVLQEFRQYFNPVNRRNFSTWVGGVKAFWQDRSNAARRAYLLEVTLELLTGYLESTKSIVLKLSHYLREQLAYRTLTKNSAGKDLLQLLEDSISEEELRAPIKALIEQINATLVEKALKTKQDQKTQPMTSARSLRLDHQRPESPVPSSATRAPSTNKSLSHEELLKFIRLEFRAKRGPLSAADAEQFRQLQQLTKPTAEILAETTLNSAKSSDAQDTHEEEFESTSASASSALGVGIAPTLLAPDMGPRDPLLFSRDSAHAGSMVESAPSSEQTQPSSTLTAKSSL